YFRVRLLDQLQAVLPVVAYLFLFQVAGLRREVLDAGAITIAILAVVLGLLFFMEGLRLWLMPIGEAIGNSLPRKSTLTSMLAFPFLVGAGATFAEPAMGALRAAGSGIDPAQAPLLHAILNRYAGPLGLLVAAGVGLSVVIGTLRFLGNWPLKRALIPIVALLLAMTLWAQRVPGLRDVVGVAWDFG